MSYSS
jgi:hypothetical protein